MGCILFCSYIKPQLYVATMTNSLCCILFCSYIKPQPRTTQENHCDSCILFCSYIKPQLRIDHSTDPWVVSYSVPISNHNAYGCRHGNVAGCILFCSYIKPQRRAVPEYNPACCILFCSYIKPQRDNKRPVKRTVVSYSVPISNHNSGNLTTYLLRLYLILFLYQTTTILA